MNYSRAFTLLSLVISMSLSSFLGLTLFFIFNQISKHMQTQKEYCLKTLHNTLVLDVMRRDVERAYFYQEGLNLSDNQITILTLTRPIKLHKNEYSLSHVTWQPRQGGLSRIKGKFDFKNSRWNKKRTTFFETTFSAIKMIAVMEASRVKAIDLYMDNCSGQHEKNRIELLNQQMIL